MQVPSWKEIPKYPVICAIALVAVVLTLAWWAGANVSLLFENAEIRRGQLWRLATNIFLHLDIIHLAFNLYWLWVLGATVERVFGHLKTALLVLFLAIGSSSLDFAFAQGGVGLSGVGYGLFGLLYVLSRHDERLRDSLDRRTINLFIGWFFLCVFTTVTGIWKVANVAHAAGAVLGVLLGYAMVRPNRRALFAAGTAVLVVLGLAGSTFARPYVNRSRYGGYEEGKWGYDALLANRNQEAVRWLGEAARYQPRISEYWFNMGIAYQRLNNQSAAAAAYERAYELQPSNPDYARAAGKITRTN
jgi:membrane associated rhomboid family serine protease